MVWIIMGTIFSSAAVISFIICAVVICVSGGGGGKTRKKDTTPRLSNDDTAIQLDEKEGDTKAISLDE